MDHFKVAADFVSRVKSENYLEPNRFREQEEFGLFRKMVEEEKFDDMSGRISGEVKPWDIELEYAMSEETDEEIAVKSKVAEQMGFQTLETGLDSTFFKTRDACMEWWDQQPYDFKRRCLERVITLLGREKVNQAARQKYQSISDGIAWQNHHTLKEACAIIEKLIPPTDGSVASAEAVLLRFEVERLEKEVERRKTLLKQKNKEVKMLREREKSLVRQLGLAE